MIGIKALFTNGMDASKRIPGSPGMRPVLSNTSEEEVTRFLDQVELVDMIDCMDLSTISAAIADLAARSPGVYRPQNCLPEREIESVPLVEATYHDPQKIRLDNVGYFVIHLENDGLLVEHYNYKEQLLRRVRGTSARDIYLTIVDNGWVSHLDHACYLGKELTRAEFSRRQDIEYTQDGA